jgi:hypothetical protein
MKAALGFVKNLPSNIFIRWDYVHPGFCRPLPYFSIVLLCFVSRAHFSKGELRGPVKGLWKKAIDGPDTLDTPIRAVLASAPERMRNECSPILRERLRFACTDLSKHGQHGGHYGEGHRESIPRALSRNV